MNLTGYLILVLTDDERTGRYAPRYAAAIIMVCTPPQEIPVTKNLPTPRESSSSKTSAHWFFPLLLFLFFLVYRRVPSAHWALHCSFGLIGLERPCPMRSTAMR